MMTEEDISLLRGLAIRFYETILRLGPNNKLFTLRQLPLGACGDSCLLLALYLKQNGFGTATYVSGWKGQQSHAWLELEDVFLDVATGQFADAPGPVIVERDSIWHLQFEDVQGHPADIDLYDERTRRILLDAYDQIVANVDRS